MFFRHEFLNHLIRINISNKNFKASKLEKKFYLINEINKECFFY